MQRGVKYIKRIFILAFVLILSINLFSCSSKKKDNFYFASYKTAEKTHYRIEYEDDYFNNKASNYNPKLASASACLALAGFSTDLSDFNKQDANAKDLFKTLGFENYLANPYGISKPTASSFGVYIASKKIDDYTLLGITVRGAGYLAEWASNFTIGKNDEFAEGFLEASDIYLNFLKEYINQFNIEGKIKIWTSGYSRGGATVNLASGRLDEALAKGENLLSDKVSYTKDDIYAYCFEAPAGKINNSIDDEIYEKGDNFSNIHCILNLNDPVPFVAPSQFNFIRYGNDLFLPDIITDLDYQKQINLVKSKMKKLPNSSVIGDYAIDSFKDESIIGYLNNFSSKYVNVTPYLFLNDLFDSLCSIIGSKEVYVDEVQDSLTELFKFIYKTASPKESLINLGIDFGKNVIKEDLNEIILFDLQNNPSYLIRDLEPILYKALKKFDVNITVSDVSKLTRDLVNVFVKLLLSENGFTTLRPLISSNNLKALGSAHIPELLLCHITSLDENYDNSGLSIKNSFNKLYISTNEEFELIINNNKYVYFDNSKLVSNLVSKKTKEGYLIYLPSDINFEIKSDYKIDYELYNHNNKYLHDKLIKKGTI